MTKDSVAQEVSRLLSLRDERVVFAESCTAGMCAATLGAIPGISKHLCGSAVTYVPKVKRNWLGVRRATIKRHTTESAEVAKEMAVGILNRTAAADWGVAVVGHIGPDAPEDKDGVIHVCCVRRTRKGRLKVKDQMVYTCKNTEPDTPSLQRFRRQEEATVVVFTCLARQLHRKSKSDGKGDTLKLPGGKNGKVKQN